MTDGTLVVAAALRWEAWTVRRGLSPGTVVRTGIGPRRSKRAGRDLRARRPPVFAVVGFGGALTDQLWPGDIVVAGEVRSGGWTMTCKSAPMLAGELRAVGLTVHVGPVVSTDHVVHGRERGQLAETGALAVDMESVTLLEAVGDTPSAVVRVIVDTPSRPLMRLGTVRNGIIATRSLAKVGPVLSSWADAVADRTVPLANPGRLDVTERSTTTEDVRFTLPKEVRQ